MKALRVTAHGRPSEVLRVLDVDRPEPGPGQVLIRVAAGSLNYNDIQRCTGALTTVPTPPPFTLGMDVCGEVTAAGEGAEGWIGQRVVAVTHIALGGLAEYAIAPAASTFVAPPGLDDAEATAFIIPFHTTHLALFERAGLKEGEWLLVHSGASGLGTAAIQLGVACGARVMATAGGPDKVKLCRELGAELVVDHRDEEFATAVLDHTKDHGADVICDLVGGDFVDPSWKCVARGGRYVSLGFAGDAEHGMTKRALRPICTGNFSIVGAMLAWVDEVPSALRRMGMNFYGRDVADRVHGEVLDWLESGRIRPIVGSRVGLEEAGAALEDHLERRSIGRTVVRIAS